MAKKHGEFSLEEEEKTQSQPQVAQGQGRQDSIFAIAHEGKQHISVTHVTIRESIMFLLLKLIALDVLTTVIALIFLSPFLTPLSDELKLQIISYNFIFVLILALVKIVLTIFVVLLWLNDYYEITPITVTHHFGIFWQKEDSFKITHIKNFGVRQGIFGKLFNYGTLHFYDWFMKREYHVYQIHNPRKYLRILEDLLPFADEDREMIREHIVQPGDE